MEESLNDIGSGARKINADQYSSLVLAYIGDAVFEMFVREKLVSASNKTVNKLHKESTALVKASSQARMIRYLKEELTEKELSIYKRGRNAKSKTVAKNASVKDYRRATGFEAVLGYLYLDGQTYRMRTLMEKAVGLEYKYVEEKE